MNSKLQVKSKKVVRFVVLGVLVLIIALIPIIYPIIYENICMNRVYEDIAAKIDDDILSSNICIIGQTVTGDENFQSTNYSQGASGVIFEKKGNTYYAITAYHVVSDAENTEYRIVPFGYLTYSEQREIAGEYIPLEEYYRQFVVANIEYVNEIYDLAVISFKSDFDYCVATISDEKPKYRDRIVTIGNPDGERFARSYGTITSKKQIIFDANDGLPANMVWQHNAYEAPGSSGSAALNEDLEIVGINIGGGNDPFGRFRYSVMIDCDQIQQLIAEWEEIR